MNSSSSTPLEAPDPESLSLIRRAQGGDHDAYEQLFERYYPRVQRLVRRQLGARLRSELESGDVIHEAMVQAIRSFRSLKAPSQPALVAWFAGIVRNRIRDLHKRTTATKRDRAEERIVDHLSNARLSGRLRFEALDDAPLPEDRIAREEDLIRLRAALARLGPTEQRLFALRQEQRLGWQEIADELGFASADAARMAYSRAKIVLARALQQG